MRQVEPTGREGIDSLQAMAAPEVAGAIDVDDAPTVDARPTRSISVGHRTYPLVLPNPRDVRLHVAAVVISIHVLGQVALGFRVSVPQILTAIGTCFVIEVAVVFARERRFVWPASAMLTGSGVALILRVPSMNRAHTGRSVTSVFTQQSRLSRCPPNTSSGGGASRFSIPPMSVLSARSSSSVAVGSIR
jgi:hypothetical protein